MNLQDMKELLKRKWNNKNETQSVDIAIVKYSFN